MHERKVNSSGRVRPCVQHPSPFSIFPDGYRVSLSICLKNVINFLNSLDLSCFSWLMFWFSNRMWREEKRIVSRRIACIRHKTMAHPNMAVSRWKKFEWNEATETLSCDFLSNSQAEKCWNSKAIEKKATSDKLLFVTSLLKNNDAHLKLFQLFFVHVRSTL